MVAKSIGQQALTDPSRSAPIGSHTGYIFRTNNSHSAAQQLLLCNIISPVIFETSSKPRPGLYTLFSPIYNPPSLRLLVVGFILAVNRTLAQIHTFQSNRTTVTSISRAEYNDDDDASQVRTPSQLTALVLAPTTIYLFALPIALKQPHIDPVVLAPSIPTNPIRALQQLRLRTDIASR